LKAPGARDSNMRFTAVRHNHLISPSLISISDFPPEKSYLVIATFSVLHLFLDLLIRELRIGRDIAVYSYSFPLLKAF
jgi:hypothetical protein